MAEPPASGDPFQLAGHTIEGKYRIASVVGDGGFGVVYRGVHKGFGELIAVKCLKMPALDEREREELLELLREEGRLLHRLSRLTPNIVQALDVGAFTTDGGVWVPYLVLEWLEGQTLARFLRERSERGEEGMSVEEAMRLLEPAARALSVAHGQRVAHRDVKPANLFLVDVGGSRTLKVLDFGIAKVLGDCASVTEALAATGQGPSAFTPRYGAPEQFSKMRGATGPWTDVFALALIFVELVSGRKALDGDDPTQLYVAAADMTMRPTLRARGVDPGDAVEQVLGRALAVEPKERYASAGEFWEALVAAASGKEPVASRKEAAAGGGEAVASGGAPSGGASSGGVSSGGAPSGGAPSGGASSSPSAPSGRVISPQVFDPTMPAESLAGRRGAETAKLGAGAGKGDPMAETPLGLRAGQPRDAGPSSDGAKSGGTQMAAQAPGSSGAPAPGAAPEGSKRRAVWPWVALAAIAGGGAIAYTQLSGPPARSPALPRPAPARTSASAGPRSTAAAPPASASASADAAASASAAPAAPAAPPEDMVYFSPATVVLGAGPDQREVTLSRGFYLDRTEVTVRAYQACVAERRCSPADHVSVTPEQPTGEAGGSAAAPPAVDQEFAALWTRRCNAPRGESQHPVNCVDYRSAEEYCRFRGRRLPTEAEWELAARGTAQRPYPWGQEPPSCERACFDRNESCRPRNAAVETCVSGGHPADRTPEGVYDLAGNVAEWVSDGFQMPPPGGTDPRGDPGAPLKVVRGGSFFDAAARLTATWRTAAAPVTAHATIGFRCALDAPQDANAADAGAQ